MYSDACSSILGKEKGGAAGFAMYVCSELSRRLLRPVLRKRRREVGDLRPSQFGEHRPETLNALSDDCPLQQPGLDTEFCTADHSIILRLSVTARSAVVLATNSCYAGPHHARVSHRCVGCGGCVRSGTSAWQ